MTAITPFLFENAHLVRMVEREGDPWFVAADVCDCLELTNSRMAVAALDDDEKGVSSTYTPGGQQEMAIISEGGLYTMILRSRKAMTPGTIQHRFRKWVTAEVIPTIRKTGGYGNSARSRRADERAQKKVRELIADLRRETNPEILGLFHAMLEASLQEMGLPAPPLDSIVGPRPPDLVTAFWREVTDIQARGAVINHAHGEDLIALRLVELRGHLAMPVTKALRDALKADPRFVAYKAVLSAITGKAVKCWVFAIPPIPQRNA